MYGSNLKRKQLQTKGDRSSASYKVARSDLPVLKNIKEYPDRSRRLVKGKDGSFLVTLKMTPCRVLSEEQRRFEAPLHGDHGSSNTNTDIRRGYILRCPPSVCGGATVIALSVKRASPARLRAKVSFHKRAARGWGISAIRLNLSVGKERGGIPGDGRIRDRDTGDDRRVTKMASKRPPVAIDGKVGCTLESSEDILSIQDRTQRCACQFRL